MTNTVESGQRSRFWEGFLLFGVLLAAGLLFFSPVRDNTFCHSGDFNLLSDAVDVEKSWKVIFATEPHEFFQPLVRSIVYLEYRLFGLSAPLYYLFNIFVHAVNALLVYYLVVTLLGDRLIARLSSLLFVFAVGNYGKAVMVASGIVDLVITMLTLLTLLFYFKNELQKGGRLLSFWFIGAVVLFLLSLMTKSTSFSILGCMLAFNIFFRSEIKKRVLNRNFLTIAVVALAVLVGKLTLLPDFPGRSDFLFFEFKLLKNFASYLVRMVFPIHYSTLVLRAGPVVQFVYAIATEIRIFVFLAIISYSIFGFIFGNRAIRFFITWTYITVTPFCFFKFPEDWLNIRYLYLVSVGFIMLLASGTIFASRLLYQRGWRKLIPYSVPLYFVLLSQFIVSRLDTQYERLAASPAVVQMRNALVVKMEGKQSFVPQRDHEKK